MLSRRSIRVKVMQSLFILNKDESLNKEQAVEFYNRAVDETYQLYLFNLYTLVEICRFSQDDKGLRQSKYIPTDEDKAFSAKLFENELIQSLVNNQDLQDLFDTGDFESKIDKDLLKRLYRKLATDDVYKKYLLEEPSAQSHLKILHELYRICRRDEVFDEIMEDNFSAWADDKSLVVGAIKKTLKGLPVKGRFFDEYYPDEETVEVFGEELLQKVMSDEEYLMSLIDPVLENWDPDRVALVDMIFIKMAICEFLNFVTIPTKVTLNEYVELAKEYSTEKSKDFINGVLDKLMRLMKEEGMIKKEGRGLLA